MQRASITKQKLSVHEVVMFICDQCEYEATRRSHISEHKKAQPDGVTFDGDQGDYKSSWRRMLVGHVKSVHEESNIFVTSVTIQPYTSFFK